MKITPITIQVNPKVLLYIRIIEESGFFGQTREEVCERLLCREIERLASCGMLVTLTETVRRQIEGAR